MRRDDAAGILLLDKPRGPTSHDMVSSTRKILGLAKTGHTGTLDPMASGLLVILTGNATKLAPYIRDDPKEYEGSILLGLSTDSMDMEGEITYEREYKGGQDKVKAVFATLVGELEQVPPMYSAVKYRGEPLYRYARRGEEVPRKSRKVRVYRAEMKGFRAIGPRAEVDFLIACSPGTYIRELAARVGDMLSCGGTLSSLRRISSGPFRIEDALSLEEMRDRVSCAKSCLLPLESALEGYRKVEVLEAALVAASNGSPLDGDMLKRIDSGIAEGDVVTVFYDGNFLGMHRVTALSPFSSRALRMM